MKLIGYVFLTALVLAGCGGGSDSERTDTPTPDIPEVPESPDEENPEEDDSEEETDGGETPGEDTPPEPAEPVVTLDVETPTVQLLGSVGDALPISVEGAWSATDLGDHSLYVRLVDEDGRLVKTAIAEVSEVDRFTLETELQPTLAVGTHTGMMTVDACKDEACEGIYSDSSVSLTLQVELQPVPEWQTHQANASHNGYVPIWINHSEFTKLWEWQRSESSEPIGGINAPVAGSGQVYISTDVYNGDAAAIALDELTGEETWRLSFGSMPALNPPAINNSTLFVSTSGHQDTKVWAISRTDGRLQFQTKFSSQWGNYLAPTVYEELVYQTGGYYGGQTYAFDINNGAELWSQGPGTSWGMDSAAVDSRHVYVHSGNKLTIFGKDNGELIGTIDDPFGNNNYDYHGSPVIGSNNNVIAFSGGAFSGLASSNAEHFDNRVISNFDIEEQAYLWTSRFTYRTFFAAAKGVIYAGKESPVALDAIDELTGEVLWSWVSPSTEDTSFHRNVVLTDNLLFVSTNKNIYAIDLETQESVWSYGEPGMMSISDNRILFLAPGARRSDGRLVAFDLRSK